MSCSENKRQRLFRNIYDSDDIFTIILARLPAKSILRFRCVCKRWNDIILSRFFGQTFYNIRKGAPKLVGYIQENYAHAHSENFHRLNSESTRILKLPGGPELAMSKCILSGIYFVNSSNGLILYQKAPAVSNHYFILNPVTARHVHLTRPLPPRFYGPAAVALVCEENTHGLVPNYKVVVAGMLKDQTHVTVNTFCSKAGNWSVSTPTATGTPSDRLERYSASPFVVDDAIHWFTRSRVHLVVYYVDSDAIQLVELPSDCKNNYCLKVARSSRDDDLWLCMHMPDSCFIKIWMVPRQKYDGYRSQSRTIPRDAWIFMHTFNIPKARPNQDGNTLQGCAYPRWETGGVKFKVPHVAIAMVNEVALCLWNLGNLSSQYATHCPHPESHFRYDFSPYMEAFSLSSYGL